jgi:hypothetical protein
MAEQTYRPAEQVVATMLQGGTALLLDLETTSYFDLNPTGALIWEALASGKTATEAASELVKTFAVDAETAQQDAEALVAELVENCLLVPLAAQVQP